MSATRSIPPVSRAALIPIAAVRANWSLSYEKIRALVIGGDRDLFHPGFQWVWNFASRPDGERDLRFWRAEVDDVWSVSRMHFRDVLSRILPLNRKEFHAGEVSELFMLTPTALMRLRGQMGGRLQTSGSFFARDALDNFIRTRWIGTHNCERPSLTRNETEVDMQPRGESPRLPADQGKSANQFRRVRNHTTTAPETDTATRQSALNGKRASIPVRTLSKS